MLLSFQFKYKIDPEIIAESHGGHKDSVQYGTSNCSVPILRKKHVSVEYGKCTLTLAIWNAKTLSSSTLYC